MLPEILIRASNPRIGIIYCACLIVWIVDLVYFPFICIYLTDTYDSLGPFRRTYWILGRYLGLPMQPFSSESARNAPWTRST